MTWALLAASAIMAAVAAAGILRPFGRAGVPVMEPLADPLEDERDGLIRSLRDLEDERGTGALGDDDYRTLRRETEVRTVAVLRALDAREGGSGEVVSAGLADLRRVSANGHGHQAPTPRSRAIPAAIIAAAVITAAVPLLAGAIGNRGTSQPITGDQAIAGSDAQAIAFFEQRVRQHPSDAAARLDLAERYLTAGMTGLAAEQFAEAMKLDPRNVEARTGLGLLLLQQGRPADALHAANEALAVDASYPEALYVKGVALVRGLHRIAPGVAALRAYLAAAPQGSHRVEVLQILSSAGSTTPEASPGA
jgi:cytochrome c-type biogenesis protein CcmH/NrfG